MVTIDVATGQPHITTSAGELILLPSDPGRSPGLVYARDTRTARIGFDLGLKGAFYTSPDRFASLVANENAIHPAIGPGAAAPIFVPEPGTLLLMASALPALGFIRRWRLPATYPMMT